MMASALAVLASLGDRRGQRVDDSLADYPYDLPAHARPTLGPTVELRQGNGNRRGKRESILSTL
jgi:hypothetical protein